MNLLKMSSSFNDKQIIKYVKTGCKMNPIQAPTENSHEYDTVSCR